MLAKTNTCHYITTEEDAKQVAKDIRDYCKIFERKGRKPKMAFDFETYSFTGRHKPVLLPDNTYEAYTRLFQIGLDPSIEDAQYLIDVALLNGLHDGVRALSRKDMNAERFLAEQFGSFLRDSLVIGQGLVFDARFLIEHYDIWMQTPRDTMLLSQKIRSGDKYSKDLGKGSHALHALYDYFIDHGLFITETGQTPKEYAFDKSRLQKSDWSKIVLDEEQLIYGSRDVGRLMFMLYEREVEELDKIIDKYKKSGLRHTYRLECAAINEFAVMDIVGIEPDLQYYDEVAVPYLEKYIDDAENDLMPYQEFWEEVKNETTQIVLMDGSKIKLGTRKVSVPYCKFINLNGKATAAGPGQLQRALSRAGLDCDDSKRETFEELLYDPDNVVTLSEKQKIILAKVIQFLKAKSMLTKYGPNLYSGEKSCLYDDGAFHPDTFQMGGETNAVDTQRTSMKNPPLQTIPSGGDIFNDGQEIGKVLRKPYKARKGKKLIVADFPNQEVRLAQAYTGDKYLRQVFEENRDQHSETAKEILGLDYLPKKGTPERQAGKTGYLGHQYCQGWKGMQAKIYEDTNCRLWIPDDKAKKMKEGLKRKFAGVTEKAEKCKLEVLTAVEPFQTLKSFENRRPIFVGFTELKYDTSLLRDIIEIDEPKVSFTRLRKWCLYINQERRIKRARRGLNEFKIRKKSLKKLAKLTQSHKVVRMSPLLIPFSNRFWTATKFSRNFKPIDTLHRSYQVFDPLTEKYSEWGNEWGKMIAKIAREYFNLKIQPEGSTWLKLTMVGIHKKFRERGWHYRDACITLEAHDEVVIEVLEELAEEAKAIVEDVMGRVLRSVVGIVPAPVEAIICDRWSEGK